MSPRNRDALPESVEAVELAPEDVASHAGDKAPPIQIVWRNVLLMTSLHLGALYGIWLVPGARPHTWFWAYVLFVVSELGITAGAHRLWSHRAYKARLPFRIMLATFNCMAAQNDIIEWSRDHRVHHRHSETDADPHNAKRGLFFAHVGWLLVRKHPEVKAKGQLIDISDLQADPVCAVQRRFYLPFVFLLCFLLPALIPWYAWQENLISAFFVCSILRYVLVLNATWCVNSFAHAYGNKPYDRHINPSENACVALVTSGEGFHNYHHVFPFDYSTSEFGWKLNLTTLLIDCGAALGQVYGRKEVANDTVTRRMERTGDGSCTVFSRQQQQQQQQQQQHNQQQQSKSIR